MNNDTEQNSTSPSGFLIAGRRIPKWVAILVVIFLALTVIGAGRHYYLAWKEKRCIRAARWYFQTDRIPEMRLALIAARNLNPDNVDAFRINAQAKLKQGDADALPYFRRAVELQPDNLNDQIALGEAALHFGRTREADKVIKDMGKKAQGRGDFHDLAGRVAQAMGRTAEVEPHFAEAVRLVPDSSSYRLHLSVLRLNADSPADREKAREEIEKISGEPALRAEALRALVIDAVKNMQTNRAVSLASDLNGTPNHLFSDRLMYLEVLHLLESPQFQPLLEETEKEATQKPENILALLYWMNGNNLALLAKDWAQNLPANLVSTVGIRLEIARAYAAFGDWKKLRFFLADEKWGEKDYMRRALLARCYRELENNTAGSKATWSEAINAAANNGLALLELGRLAMDWRWNDEAAEALWPAATRSNRSAEALNTLGQVYFKKRDTAGLFRVYALLIERNPNDAATLNNFAIFSLLLNKDKARAENIARDLHAKNPASPVYASTYAFALYCGGKIGEALDVMKSLKPAELKEPSIAAYYSAMLQKAGLNTEAREYKELAQGASLLPEEEEALNLAPAPTAATPPRPTPAPTPAKVAERPTDSTPEFVEISGEVATGGRVQYNANLTIMSAIACAGGFNASGDQKHVKLVRAGKTEVFDTSRFEKYPALNVNLRPGDQIVVPNINDPAEL